MKARQRFDMAKLSLLMQWRTQGEVPDRRKIHETAKRYQLHEAQERRLVSEVRKETDGQAI